MKMKKSKIMVTIALAALMITTSFPCFAVSSISETEYLDSYKVLSEEFYKCPQSEVDLKGKELLDVIEYYLENDNDELTENLFVNGMNSGKELRTILDSAEGPCDCEPGGPCWAENNGSLCCCHQKLYVCRQDTGIPPMVEGDAPPNPPAVTAYGWYFQRNCGSGCCGDVCCEDVSGDNCFSDKQCYLKYGPCKVCPNPGGDCISESNQCNGPADCNDGWFCSGFCCVLNSTTTTTSTVTTQPSTTLACPFTCGNGVCEAHMTQPEFDEAERTSACYCPKDCGVIINCTSDSNCTFICGPKWICNAAKVCEYTGSFTGCKGGDVPMCACVEENGSKARCMEVPGDAISLVYDNSCNIYWGQMYSETEGDTGEEDRAETETNEGNNLKLNIPFLGEINIPWF